MHISGDPWPPADDNVKVMPGPRQSSQQDFLDNIENKLKEMNPKLSELFDKINNLQDATRAFIANGIADKIKSWFYD
jgi:Mg2+ and Co2+ transporter CorA